MDVSALRSAPGRTGQNWRLRKPSGTHVLDLAWEASLMRDTDQAQGARPALDHSTVDPHHQVWVGVDEGWRTRFEYLCKRVVQLLVGKGIVIESCPSSNRAVAGIPKTPLLDLLKEDGLRCGIATDDPGLLAPLRP